MKGPASAASGKTQCLQISSQVLLLHLPWSTIVKEPLRIFKIKLPAAALSPRFAFFLLWMPPKPPVCCSFLFALETVRFILECRQASTPLLFGNAVFLTVFNSGREGKNTSVLAVFRFRSEDIACCFHYCTLDLHMQEKVECLKHHTQLRVFANLK